MTGYLNLSLDQTWYRFIGIVTTIVVLLMGEGALAQQQYSAQLHNSAKKKVDSETIFIFADNSLEWMEGKENRAILNGRCKIVKGETVLVAQQMGIWLKRVHQNGKTYDFLEVYMEGDARAHLKRETKTENRMFVNLVSQTGIKLRSSNRHPGKPSQENGFWNRAGKRKEAHDLGKRHEVRQVQFRVPQPSEDPELNSVYISQQETRYRRVRINPRSAVQFNVVSFESKNTSPPEQVTVLTGGVNLLIDGIKEYGTIDLSADRIVIWTQQNQNNGFNPDSRQTKETPYTVYMEGNIVIRQGDRIIRAPYAVYDAREDRGLMLDAELKAFIPQAGGSIRIRAKQLRQLSRSSFHAKDAWTTTSTFGKPGYKIQSSDIFFNERFNSNPWLGTGNTAVDPLTGMRYQRPIPWVEARNNRLVVEGIPLFYTPLLSGPAKDAKIPLRGLSIGNDQIYGTKLKTKWNAFQLLGLDEPDGVQWDLNLDYLSLRGPAGGSELKYAGEDLFGIPGIYSGKARGYYVNDGGLDRLGADRNKLIPKSDDRWMGLWRHRQTMPGNTTWNVEFGLVSDRNFFEQYNYNAFISEKDPETLIYGTRTFDNISVSVLARPQLNAFEYQTGWLPKGDLYVLSEPLFNGMMTYSSHSSAGYANLKNADAPTDPNDIFSPIPYMANGSGGVFMTRHGVDAPFNLGALKITPYAWGEAAYWQQDLTGNQLDRLVGSVGVKSSLLMWKVFPYVNSRILNISGLAHKIRFEAEYAYTDSSANLNRINQYEEIDDNAQERFRERLLTNTFGGVLPATFDPRFYAVRTGAGSSITSPYYALVEDQQVVRGAIRQRIQTKVGPPERRRIKDWMTLDLEGAYFPNASRDNFGADVGLLSANYRWNVGDRTSLLADAYYDIFNNNQQLWSVGIVSQRGRRGSVYLGLRQVKGGNTPLISQLAIASMSYKMGPKWVSTLSTAYDISEGRNRGQSLTITRIGKDFLFHFGFNYNESLSNTGIALAIEPRFLGSKRGSKSSGPSAMNMGSLFNGGR